MSLLANGWAQQGKNVTLLTFDGGAPGYPIHPAVSRRSLGMLRSSGHAFQALINNWIRVRDLRRAIRESHPDIVISFVDRTNILTLLATRRTSIPVIVSERVDPSQYNIGYAWSALRTLSYRFAEAIVCQTSSVLDWFPKRTKMKGVVIPNPVTASPRSAVATESKRQDCSVERTIVAMGRLVPQKGFELLLDAFSRVAKHHSNWSLVIVGGGPLRDQLETQARTLFPEGRVHFMGEVADPFPVLCASDLFVLSSRFEGFPNALCEAMACGLPVVSFDCPSGPADIIRDGIDGVLVAPEDVAALAAVLGRLMGDAEERARLASRAPEVVTRFSVEKILSLWQQLFDELLSVKQDPADAGRRVRKATGPL